MRQTSQAVLLLIASAQAANNDAVVNYKATTLTTTAGAAFAPGTQGGPVSTFLPGTSTSTGMPVYAYS
jgi:hypothetical protein